MAVESLIHFDDESAGTTMAPEIVEQREQTVGGQSEEGGPRPHRPHGPRSGRAARFTFYLLLAVSAVFGAMCGLMLVYSVDLPQMDDLVRYRPSTTSTLYDIHGKPFGTFALERRVVVPYSELPANLRNAIISIEDKSFQSNWGVNLVRAVGAAYRDLHSKGRAQGASTLTMQLARNLFLSSEKTYGRKVQEVLLSVQIERRFTKEQIFALYANQIYLGHGTYGFEAGSEFYFSKHVKDLTLPEAAMLAALPKGPEAYSPIRNPDKALKRRNLVLSEMLHDAKISQAEAQAAEAAPLGLRIETPANSIAPYFVEEVRRQLEKQYGVEEVHGAGLRVDTTIDLDLQAVANKAILDGTATYERRRGWQGQLQNVVLAGLDADAYRHPDWTQAVVEGSYFHALVGEVAADHADVKIGVKHAVLREPDWRWTQNPTADSFLKTGDLIYVKVDKLLPDGTVHVLLEQDSGAQASMMAMDNSNGEVLALVGGRDFAISQFNRATQAQRQVGSSFKPYVYTTAVEDGAKPSDIITDVPTSFPTPSGWYTPHNYEGDYKGAMTLLSAFAESRNIPALKLAHKEGIAKVIETAHRFGITSNIPAFLPVAIGSADITLAEQVGAYSVFPNDGIRIEPHYIRRVTESDGTPLREIDPVVKEVISVDTARTMMTLLKAVVTQGTGAAASQLHHPLGGKTGTTNDYTDAWFVGFSPGVTCGTWIGFDNRQSLGEKETGARAALPMWMDFMRAAIVTRANETFATEGAPKRRLDVAVPDAAPASEEKPAADDDSDAPAGASQQSAPADKMPQDAPDSDPGKTSIGPALTLPARPAAPPVKRTPGVAKMPPAAD